MTRCVAASGRYKARPSRPRSSSSPRSIPSGQLSPRCTSRGRAAPPQSQAAIMQRSGYPARPGPQTAEQSGWAGPKWPRQEAPGVARSKLRSGGHSPGFVRLCQGQPACPCLSLAAASVHSRKPAAWPPRRMRGPPAVADGASSAHQLPRHVGREQRRRDQHRSRRAGQHGPYMRGRMVSPGRSPPRHPESRRRARFALGPCGVITAGSGSDARAVLAGRGPGPLRTARTASVTMKSA